MTDDSVQIKFEKLKKWIIDNGGNVDEDIYIDVISDGVRGLKVAQKKLQNQVLISVNKKCTIISDRKVEGISEQVMCCLKFIQEYSGGKESFYFPYFDILPTIEDLKKDQHQLMIFDETDYPQLQKISPKLVQGHLEATFHKEVKTLFKLICEDSDLDERFKTLDLVKYALTLYHSRAWGNFGFIPLTDMTNHKNDPDCSGHVENPKDRNVINFSIPKPLNKGDEILWQYNFFSPVQLYMNYNINPDLLPNHQLTLPIEFKLDEDTEINRLRRKLIRKNRLNRDKTTYIFTVNGMFKDINRIFPTIRVAALDENDMVLLRLNCEKDEEKEVVPFMVNMPICIDNEFRCIKTLLKYLRDCDICGEELDSKKFDKKYLTLIKTLNTQYKIVHKNISDLETYWLGMIRG